MNPLPSDQLLEQLQWRYATKQFNSSKKISAKDWTALEDALALTPSSFGLQPWKFLVITNADLRQKLQTASWGQAQVTDCSQHVVFAIRTDVDAAFVSANMELTASLRGVPVESLDGFKNVVLNFLPRINTIEWATRQAYIALGNLMTSAAMIGVDTCPMEGIDAAKYDEILGLAPKNLKTVVACSLGYRAESDKYSSAKKVRFPKSALFEHH
ncbi:MAG: NAD(P)H-dependent oxidoreductase [Blastochloris sp.]|nr:NAD(P)H-dependent oxidoreductase [Blastochloris sp.]